MKCVLVGFGEIGKAVYEVFTGPDNIILPHDPDKGYKVETEADLLLVAIPYFDDFVKVVKAYQKQFKVKATVIFSTVPIGTTSKLENAVHSPVEGKHPDLAMSMKKMLRYIGGDNALALEFMDTRFLYHEAARLSKPEHTEALKLLSTTLYGLNIEFARYSKKVCDEIGLDFEYVKGFNYHYNELYKSLGLPQFQRYILDPPEGPKGGHCVVPNAKILNKQYPNEMVRIVSEE